jgi:uncharacterized repeat protein (TIGR03833 family)
MSRRNNNRHHQRSGDRTNNASTHLIGTEVSVIQKHDQSTGRLTKGIIAEILTNSASHPRGIKVRLEDGTVGRIGDPSSPAGPSYFDDNNNSEAAPPRGASLADFMTPANNASWPTPAGAGAPPVAVAENTPDWACFTCTFVNSGLLSECEMCQTKRS